MAVYKIDGVDGVSHLPKKFMRLNTQIPASTSTTFTKGEVMMMDVVVTDNGAGQNVLKAVGDDLAVGELCGHDGVNPALAVGDATTGVTTRAFAICVVAATTTPSTNYTDLELLIYDHGLYG